MESLSFCWICERCVSTVRTDRYNSSPISALVCPSAINRWIRTSGAFDGVINFARAVADPRNPEILKPAYDSGDHLHPDAAGYRAMANAISLPMLLNNA